MARFDDLGESCGALLIKPVNAVTYKWSLPEKVITCCYGKFPFNFKLFRSVLALSVAVVSALSARRLAWLLRFVCVLAVCGSQVVNGFVWKRVYFGLTDDNDEVI